MYKLLVLTESDISSLQSAYSRLSQDIHVTPETLNPETVSHADLATEVKALEDWFDDLDGRQKKAVKKKV